MRASPVHLKKVSLFVMGKPDLETASPQSYKLDEFTELRYCVPKEKYLYITLASGYLYINGFPLLQGKKYCFTDSKSFFFTMGAPASVSVVGYASTIYKSSHSTISKIRQFVLSFEKQRKQGVGPRILLTGHHFSGRSTYCKIFGALSLMLQAPMIFADVDVRKNAIGFPGFVSATEFNPVGISIEEEGLGSSSVISYIHGEKDPLTKYDNYLNAVSKLAGIVEKKLKGFKDLTRGGLILKSPIFDSENSKHQQELCNMFKIDTVIVLGDQGYFHQLSNSLHDLEVEEKKETKKYFFLESSVGIQRQDIDEYNGKTLKEYFYGKTSLEYKTTVDNLTTQSKHVRKYFPFTRNIVISVNSKYKFVRATKGNVSLGILPIGVTSLYSNRKVEIISKKDIFKSAAISNCIIAISTFTFQKSDSDINLDEILDKSIAGYAYVSEVSEETQSISLLTPSPGPLPSTVFFVTSVRVVLS